MATRILKIYVNGQYYKDIPVETVDGSYDPGPIIQQLNADKQQGLLNQFDIPPGTFPLRIELPINYGDRVFYTL